MEDNSYEPDSSITSQPTLAKQVTTVKRPVWVSVLAVLHFVGGFVYLGTQFIFLANLNVIEPTLHTFGMTSGLMIFALMVLAILSIASGIGMWIGVKWGWWLGAFYYIYSIFRNASAVLMVISMTNVLEVGSREPEYYLIKHSGRIVLHFLIFLYFFKGNVLEFFHLEGLSKPKAIGIMVGICIVISAVVSAIG